MTSRRTIAILLQVASMPACDDFTAAILRTVARGEAGPELGILAHVRARQLATAALGGGRLPHGERLRLDALAGALTAAREALDGRPAAARRLARSALRWLELAQAARVEP